LLLSESAGRERSEKGESMRKAGYAMVKLFLTKLRRDNVSAFAAQAAFFVILSFLPFLICLLTLVKFLPIGEERLLFTLQAVFPPAVHDFIGGLLSEARQKASGTLRSVSAVTALWSASRGVLVIIRGMNAVYGNKETRNYVVLRLISLGYTLLFAVVLALALVVLVFGNRIYASVQSSVPVAGHGTFFVIGLRTVFSFLFLTGFFLWLYVCVPNRKPAQALSELPGAVLSATGWMGFSFLFSYYIDHMGRFSAMYGSLTAVVLCMIWLYACMYIMFLGAEVNEAVAEGAIHAEWEKVKERFRRKSE